MKKTLKWVAGVGAAVMLMSGSMTTVAMAANTSSTTTTQDSYRDYLLSFITDAIIIDENTVYVPGYGTITKERYDELRQTLLYMYLGGNSTYYPGLGTLPGTGTGSGSTYYPGTGSSPFYEISLSVDQYSYLNLQYLGTNFSFYSTDTSIATVYNGYVYGVAPGETIITAYNGMYTQYIIRLTVNEVSDANLSLSLSASTTSLQVGSTATVYAYLNKYNTQPWLGNQIPADITLTSSNTDVITVSGRTVYAVGVGTATLTARHETSGLEETLTFTVYSGSSSTYPSYPGYFYPGYYYPGFFYPNYGTITAPTDTTSINWASILRVDTEVYNLQQTYTYQNGSWMRTFKLVPKDGSTVDEYTTTYKRIYVTGAYMLIAIQTPVSYTPTEKEDTPTTPSLSEAELEALKKAEEAARKAEELKNKIAQAMKGEIEWYEVYSDLYGDSYYSAGVKFALENLYVTGNEDGTFGTSTKMTFGDVETVLCKYFGVTAKELSTMGIISYKKADTLITREEIALVLQKAADKLGIDTSNAADLTRFDDYDELDDEYRTAFGWAYNVKLLTHDGDEIDPNGTVTKARLCQMLYRLDKLANAKTSKK